MTKALKYTCTWTFKVPGDYTIDLPEEVREITITCGGAGGGGAELDLPSIKHSAPGGYGSEVKETIVLPKLPYDANSATKKYLRVHVGKGGDPAILVQKEEDHIPFVRKNAEDGGNSSVVVYAFSVPKNSTNALDAFTACDSIEAHGGVGAFLDVHSGCDNGFSIGNNKGGSGGSELYDFYGQPGYVEVQYSVTTL